MKDWESQGPFEVLAVASRVYHDEKVQYSAVDRPAVKTEKVSADEVLLARLAASQTLGDSGNSDWRPNRQSMMSIDLSETGIDCCDCDNLRSS